MSEVSMTETLAQRERLRELYWKRSDPILNDRMFWRAQTFRHIIPEAPNYIPRITFVEQNTAAGS